MRNDAPRLRRQYFLAALIFGFLLVASFVLFAQLLVERFSRSYLEGALLSGRAQAEELAKQFEGGGPLYRVIETRREALAKVSAALSRQEIIQTAQVYDERGKLVWSTTTRAEGYTGGFPDPNAELLLPTTPDKVVETGSTYEIRVPLEDLGTVVVAVSKEALTPRIAVLRRRLFLHTAIAAGTSLGVLAAAVAFIWHLVQRNAALEQRKRFDEELAALGSLAANLAHEIRNPLNALSLNLELLEEDLCEGGTGAEAAGLARREAGRLSRLVNDFLVYARPSVPALEKIAGEDLLAEVATLLRPTCERAGVTLEVDAVPFQFEGDRGQLGQVLVNLALNAVQAMEDGHSGLLRLRGAREGESAVLEVVDSGPGIPDSELARVREAFYTRRKGGTGLGLAIAERIVDGHGGTLELSNRSEGGLVARVRLPAAPRT